MKDNGKISVIIPVYNVDRYLETCLNSVIEQTYKQIEIILIDDGSSDKSPLICDEFAGKDNRIKVLHQLNRGLASARNSGMEIASGNYFFFLDSDDCIHPQLFEILIDIMLKECVDIVQVEKMIVDTSFKTYSQELPLYRKVYKFDKIQALINLDEDNKEISEDIRLVSTVIWSKLYKASIFEDIHFYDGLRIHEDQMIIHRLLEKSSSICFVNLPLYYYRCNPDSLIQSHWKKDKLIILDCYEDRLKCVLEIKDINTQYLCNLIYYRYLVCIIRNYMMVQKNLKGVDRKKTMKNIHERFCGLFKRRRKFALKKKEYLFFVLYKNFPILAVYIKKIIDRRKDNVNE